MGFMERILDFMRLNDDDYEYDNEDYDTLEEEEEEAKSSKKDRKESRTAQERSEAKETETKEKASSRSSQPKITPITKPSRKQVSGMEVCVIKPTSIEDEIEITETLLNGRTVVINMEGLNVDIAQRIIDFTSGSTFAMHGNLQKISNYIFLATPNGVDISGDITSLMDTFDSSSTSGFTF